MPQRVVIADDDPAMRCAIYDLLAGADGLECIGEAADAATAIELAVRLRPEVVVLDVRMPGGGPYAARGILTFSPGTAVVALSAHDDLRNRRRMLDAGVSVFLTKGLRGRDLLAALRALQDAAPA